MIQMLAFLVASFDLEWSAAEVL